MQKQFGIWLNFVSRKVRHMDCGWHLSNVIFEMDCKTVVDDRNFTRNDASEYGTMILECKNNLLNFSQHSNVVFVKRQNKYGCSFFKQG